MMTRRARACCFAVQFTGWAAAGTFVCMFGLAAASEKVALTEHR